MGKLIGANYRTTLTNLVALVFATATAIAAAPSELDMLPTSLYPYRGRIIAVCGIVAFVSRLLNGQFQKDKQVTGGTIQQTVNGNVAAPGTQSLVDETVKASVASDETIEPEQWKAVH
jgi:hypothetical protein